MKPTYESPLAARYASRYMLHLFSPDSRFETWRRLWVALARAQHQLGLPITALKTADAGTVGSAMLTGIAVGCFRDLADAAERMVKPMETYFPRQEMHEKYEKIYMRYRGVYDAVRPLM